ncbi:MAG: pyridoxal phosphate-dependent aminotransferase [Deltaproteobacteria bacterium]|jgi:aspartate aminotransferase|nr:pyridoxal phosphate-dependent aminotransferase [Deltaproteobacteria bacterium]
MLVSEKMRDAVNKGSLIRAMFEDGIKLKNQYGADNVFDFSLGNPDLSPPTEFAETLSEVIKENKPGVHGYMPNAGLEEVRKAFADYVTEQNKEEFGETFVADNVVLTVGAAGGINCVLKAVLDPGDEVMVLAPYFVEYGFYADNHAGVIVQVETDRKFRPDPEALAKSITPKTRALIVNTPNNPTGAVYDAGELKAIGDVLTLANQKLKRPIVLIADEPYKKIVFDGKKAPSIFASYPYSISVTSFSKDLSIPGERLGYVTISPKTDGDAEELFLAVTLANRILGSVNAPALVQRTAARLLRKNADLSVYEKRSKLLSEALADMGYDLTPPEGTFYLFPKCPIESDSDFTVYLRQELILAVPGTGFKRSGHFRLSLCADEEHIRKSLNRFKVARENAMNKKPLF